MSEEKKLLTWSLGGAEPIGVDTEFLLIGTSSYVGVTWYQSTALTYVSLPECSEVWGGAFQQCSALSIVSIPICMDLGQSAFKSCYNLISLYLNGVSSVTTLRSTDVFSSTPIGGYSDIAGQYGSVYVPSSLYNAFCSATNWRTISARIVPV